MDVAVDRIRRALRDHEPIVLFGDYDVDGLTSAALLHHFFRFLDAQPFTIIPHRLDEGYGLSAAALERLPAHGGLLISVDTGIGSSEEVELLRERRFDVIVTDHHEPTGTLPRALAVINPKRRDSEYPFRGLAGVGVAFKLVSALATDLSPARKSSAEFRTFLLDALALVGLGTIADVAPLVDENRILATFGLRAVESCANPGIRALVEAVGLKASRLRTPDIGFRLGPRIIGAGRMGSADAAFKLLTATTEPEARRLAALLETENERRQDVERRITAAARRRIEEDPLLRDAPLIVLWDDEWHPGVIGIVAAKLVELYHKPILLVALRGDRGRCSGRSPEGFDLLAAIEAGASHLLSFGGHARAAGLEIERSHLEEFARDATEAARAASATARTPVLEIDLEVDLEETTQAFVSEVERLSPFGEGNPPPLFTASSVRLAGRPTYQGRGSKLGSFFLEKGGVSRRAKLHPSLPAESIPDPVPERMDLVISPRCVHESAPGRRAGLGGSDEVELLVRDLRPAP